MGARGLTDITWAEVQSAFRALDSATVAGIRGRSVESVDPVEAFDMGVGAGIAVADLAERGQPIRRHVFPLVRREDATIAIAAAGDGAWRALATAIAEGRTVPAVPRETTASGAPGPITAALVCRPASGLGALEPGGAREIEAAGERSLADVPTNRSVVIGERLLLKAYRPVEDGLNPELELNAWLAEEVGFGAVPALGGYAEVVTSRGAATVALLQEYVRDAVDGFEATVGQLTEWILAPGEVTVEYATEIAAGMGELTAALHAALMAVPDAPGFEMREATRQELRQWRRDGQRHLQQALDAFGGDEHGRDLRGMTAAVAEQLSVFEAVAAVPVVARTHGDLQLGQVLLAPEGPRIVGFEGDPATPIEDRRRPASPLRDAASMLRSLDHAGRSALRDAELRRGGPVVDPGVDIDAWLRRARARYLAAYRAGLRAGGVAVDVDEDLLRAWELDRECHELVRAAERQPDRTWVSLDGLRDLVEEAGRA